MYGLTELHREEVKKARLVANPGCYPTSVQLPLCPLLEVSPQQPLTRAPWAQCRVPLLALTQGGSARGCWQQGKNGPAATSLSKHLFCRRCGGPSLQSSTERVCWHSVSLAWYHVSDNTAASFDFAV